MKLPRHWFAVEGITPGVYILRGVLINWSLCKGKWPEWPGTWKSFIKVTSKDSEKAWLPKQKKEEVMSVWRMLSENGNRLILCWVVGLIASKSFREPDLNKNSLTIQTFNYENGCLMIMAGNGQGNVVMAVIGGGALVSGNFCGSLSNSENFFSNDLTLFF